MEHRGAYGERLAQTFHMEHAPAFVTRNLRKSSIAVTEINCRIENNGMTAPIPTEDAFLATMQLQDCARHDLWIDGRAQRTGFLRAGTTSIYDLRCSPVVNSVSSFHNIHFYVPHAALNAIAESEGLPRVGEFRHRPGFGIDDAVFRSLAFALMPAFENEQPSCQLFVDHITVATAAHLLQVVGGATSLQHSERMLRLSAMQEALAKDLIESRLGGALCLAEVAAQCGLTPVRFSRAFRASVGMAPYRWMLKRRVEKAMDLLRSSQLPDYEIAAICGFSNRHALYRAITRRHDAHPL